MSANPHANGGMLRVPLRLPDFGRYARTVDHPGQSAESNTGVLGEFLRDVMRLNMHNFRVFGPDETASNRLQAIYEASKKTWLAELRPEDADGGELAPDGRVMEMLSEHTLEGWMEGYLLTGRHGVFATYEAFAHLIDSMVGQHAKWLEKCRSEVAWRAPVASLNILISSTVWRQDHNGFTHQDPGFIDVVTNKSAQVTRIYLPPDANCLLSVSGSLLAQHQLHQRDRGRQAASPAVPPRWMRRLSIAARVSGIWEWASNDQGCEPDVVMASAGDVATIEALAATAILRERLPDLKIRFVNVVDLFKLQPSGEHPHGLSDRDFDSLFTTHQPVILNFHGYPWLIHKLAYRRANHTNFHVRGYKESAVSIRRCNWRSAIRPTASTWRSTRSIACRACATRPPMSRIGYRTRFTKTCATPCKMGSTKSRSLIGNGRCEPARVSSLRLLPETRAAHAREPLHKPYFGY